MMILVMMIVMMMMKMMTMMMMMMMMVMMMMMMTIGEPPRARDGTGINSSLLTSASYVNTRQKVKFPKVGKRKRI